MVHKSELQDLNLTTGQMNLVFRGRMLWRDLATWLATYMFSVSGGYGNQDAISERLYRLPLDYGNVMKLFFGDKLSEHYINLLSIYIVVLQSLFLAMIKGDASAVNDYAKRLYQNIDQMSAFLAQINPFWQQDVWSSLLYNINGLAIGFATTLLTRDFQRNVDIYDRLLSTSSVIGDYFTEGIFNYLNSAGGAVQPKKC